MYFSVGSPEGAGGAGNSKPSGASDIFGVRLALEETDRKIERTRTETMLAVRRSSSTFRPPKPVRITRATSPHAGKSCRGVVVSAAMIGHRRSRSEADGAHSPAPQALAQEKPLRMLHSALPPSTRKHYEKRHHPDSGRQETEDPRDTRAPREWPGPRGSHTAVFDRGDPKPRPICALRFAETAMGYEATAANS